MIGFGWIYMSLGRAEAAVYISESWADHESDRTPLVMGDFAMPQTVTAIFHHACFEP